MLLLCDLQVIGPASKPVLWLLGKIASCDSNLALSVHCSSQVVKLNRIFDPGEWNLPAEILAIIKSVRESGDDFKLFRAFSALPAGHLLGFKVKLYTNTYFYKYISGISLQGNSLIAVVFGLAPVLVSLGRKSFAGNV